VETQNGRLPADHLDWEAMDQALIEKIDRVRKGKWHLDEWRFRSYDLERPPFHPTHFEGTFHTDIKGHVLKVVVGTKDVTYEDPSLDWKEVTSRVGVITVSLDGEPVFTCGDTNCRVGYKVTNLLVELAMPYIHQFLAEKERRRQAERETEEEKRRQALAKARSVIDRL